MSTKNLVVFGANGRVGRLIVEYALADGHYITAFVHRKHDLPDSPLINIVQGDIYNIADVEKALRGADAVVSALGSWGTPKKDVLAAAMTNIIPIMQKLHINKIVSLTGADARARGDTLGLLHRMSHVFFSLIAGKVLRDGERHIRLLEASNLDWVVIRSPVMRPVKSITYTLNDIRPMPWASVQRSAVARAMLTEAVRPSRSQGAPFIH